jgi:hypothetical protein
MSDEVRNVFISHVHEDDEGLGRLKSLLAKDGFTIRDSSINSETPNKATAPDYIKTQILAPQINWAGTLIVYISPKTHTSNWVDWEIEYAAKKAKRIVGVWAQGAKDSDIPAGLDEYADAVVGWNSDRIIGAITGELDDWVNPNDRPRQLRPIARYSCR